METYSLINNTVVTELRTLHNLAQTGASSRVLNLNQTFIDFSEAEDYSTRPFFQNKRLNRCIIVKHTVRSHESDLFHEPRRIVTKIIFPFDPYDLRLGGNSLFIGQKNYNDQIRDILANNEPSVSPDFKLLNLLDDLPSFDPFFISETLKLHNYNPASFYRSISTSDVEKMMPFVEAEIATLIQIAIGNSMSQAAQKFATKILTNETDEYLLPLKATLQMADKDFTNGIFCWRGFLYFKWRLNILKPILNNTVIEINKFKPFGSVDFTTKSEVSRLKRIINSRLSRCIEECVPLIHNYEGSFKNFIDLRSPKSFRDFLLSGNKHFHNLGENIGILDHISSYWNYAAFDTKTQKPKPLPAEVFLEILTIFAEQLNYRTSGHVRAA